MEKLLDFDGLNQSSTLKNSMKHALKKIPLVEICFDLSIHTNVSLNVIISALNQSISDT